MPLQIVTRDFKAFTKATATVGGALWALAQISEFFKILEPSKYGLFGVIIISILSLFVGAGYAIAQAYWRKTTVVFSVFDRVLAYLPLFFAVEAGYFRKRGINVQIICAHGDKETWNDVEDGKAHFGLSDPVVMLHENAKGGRLVATIVNRATIWGITRKRLPYFHQLSDIPPDLTIYGYEEPTTTYRALIQLKNSCGAKIKTFKSGDEEVTARESDADVVLLPEPFASEWVEKHKGYSRVLDGPNLFGELAWSGVYCSKDYLIDHSDIVQNVVDALQEALVHIRSEPLDAQKVAKDIFSDFDGTAICTATLRMIKQSIFPPELITSRTEWDQAIIFWGLSDKKLRFESFVDNSFANAALKKRAND